MRAALILHRRHLDANTRVARLLPRTRHAVLWTSWPIKLSFSFNKHVDVDICLRASRRQSSSHDQSSSRSCVEQTCRLADRHVKSDDDDGDDERLSPRPSSGKAPPRSRPHSSTRRASRASRWPSTDADAARRRHTATTADRKRRSEVRCYGRRLASSRCVKQRLTTSRLSRRGCSS